GGVVLRRASAGSEVPSRKAVTSLVLLFSVSACAVTPDWVDPLAPRRDRDAAVEVLTFLWKKKLVERGDDYPQEFSSVAASKNRIYVGSQSGVLFALGPDNGVVRWRASVGATSSRPLVEGNRIYLGTDDGTLIALDSDNGRTLWRYPTKGSILQPPIVVGDTVLFSNEDDHVYALDRDSGQWRWQYDRETPDEFTIRGHAGVATDGEQVFCGFSDGHLVALSAQSGKVEWVRSLAGNETRFVDVDATPAIAGGALYATSVAAGIHALDASSGTELWKLPVRGAGSPSIDDEGKIYFAAANEGLYAIDPKGRVLWRQGLRTAGDPARPVVDGDLLFLSLSSRGLMVVDRNSGRLLQEFSPGSGVSSEPTIHDQFVYVLSNGGVLYAFARSRE
ncbi:MAG: PQQ-binding-like beta-propeller repeat protein, partial [Pseudomonadota bacterium]